MTIDNETLKQWAAKQWHMTSQTWSLIGFKIFGVIDDDRNVIVQDTTQHKVDREHLRQIASAPALAAEVLALRQSIASCIDMIDNCAGVPRQPDGLPMMVLHELRQALKGGDL